MLRNERMSNERMSMYNKYNTKQLAWQALSQKLSPLYHKVFDYFIDQSSIKQAHRAYYRTIALRVGCSEKTVRRAVKKLVELGLLTKINTGFMNACIFSVNQTVYKLADYFRYKFKSLLKYCQKAVWEQNVRHSKSISSLVTPRSNKVTQVRQIPPQTGTLKIEKTKKMEIAPPKISPTLQEITKSLMLNRRGQLKLMVFDDRTLASCWKEMRNLSYISDKFAYLITACLEFCKRNDIEVDWDLYYLALKRYNLRDSREFIIKPKYTKPVFKAPEVRDLSHHRRFTDKIEPHPRFMSYFNFACRKE